MTKTVTSSDVPYTRFYDTNVTKYVDATDTEPAWLHIKMSPSRNAHLMTEGQVLADQLFSALLVMTMKKYPDFQADAARKRLAVEACLWLVDMM